MKTLRCFVACLAVLAACSKDKPAGPPVVTAGMAPSAAVDDKPTAQPAAKPAEKPAAPVASGPKDPEIAALYAKIAGCDAKDLSKCPEAEQLKTLAGVRNKDAAQQKPTWQALLDCLDAGNSAQRYACVMAAHFEVYLDGRFDDVATGKRVLAAAQTETSRYPSSRLGEFLAGWLESEATTVMHGDLVAFVKDQAMPEPARLELVRQGYKAMKRLDYVDALYGLMTDAKSSLELRRQILNVLSRLQPAQVPRFETWLLGKTEDADAAFALTVIETLGSIGGAQSLDAVLAAWKAQSGGADKNTWAASTGRSMQRFLQRKDAGIDRKQAYDAALAIAKDDSLTGFWRGSAIYALQLSGEPKAHKDLQALVKDKDADCGKRAAEAVAALDKAAAGAK